MSSASKLEEIQRFNFMFFIFFSLIRIFLILSGDPLFKGLSFDSISAVGAHAADIHYSTSNETNKQITKNEIYLLDAGAQYLDCTSDITRTHYFNDKPSDKEIVFYKIY